MERIKIFCWVLVFCNLLTIGIEASLTAPTISIDVTPIDVREDTALETKLPSSCTTSDTDNTTTADGTYYVEFNGGNGDRRFVVVGHSCDLYLVRPLDYESAAKTYTLQVEAKDLTTLSSTSNLLINVVDANDNAPTCRLVVGTLPEDASAGDYIADVSTACTDPDTGTGGEMNYRVVSGDTAKIAVDLTTGAATLKAATLDYETSQLHSVVVDVFDKGTPSLTSQTTVYLAVTDVDDNTPTFNDPAVYTTRVDENVPLGTTIHTFLSTDLDPSGTDNAKVTYGFEIGPTPDWITIDTSTGALIVKDTIDFETSATITCKVFVYSSNKVVNNSLIDVTVNVNDLNDRTPTFAQVFYEATVPESATFGDTVITVVASDGDAGADITYSLSGSPDFKIADPTVGSVTIKQQLDYETTPVYLVELTASDGTLSSSVYLKITVDPVNEDPPVFSGATSFAVSEDAVPGTSVFEVTASDKDSGLDGEIEFIVVNGGTPFSVDSGTGVVRVAANLDYETDTSYSLVIRARDKSTATRSVAEQTITVTVTDVNDVTVTCDSIATQVIPDPNSVNYVVATLACSNIDDPPTAVTYSILSEVALPSGTTTAVFSLTGSNLVLTGDPQNTRYLVTIEATDGTNSTQVEIVIITETQLRLTALTSPVTVDEGVSGNTLHIFNWTDVFPFARVTITSGNDDNKVILYSTSGDLVLLSPYDRETTGSYNYFVQASTSSNQVATTTLTVEVNDVNDNTPKFESSIYFVSISENAIVGTTIITLTATDLDSAAFGPVAQSIVSGNDFDTFGLNLANELTLNSTLDYEVTGSYTLVVHAIDGGSPIALTGSTTVIISVENFDDERPVVVLTPSTSTLTLSENNALGATVVKVQATDTDKDTVFTYSIDSGNTDGDFAIDPVSGIVRQVKLLDRERTDSYTLILKATDQNNVSSTATLTIAITDINDNDPAFSQPVYEFNVDHNTGMGVSIGNLSVVDADDAVNAETDVVIDDAGVTGIFSLSGLQVETATIMDYEVVRRYSFQVKVTDKGATSRSGTARVVVNVLPATEEPKFDPVLDTITIDEGTLAGYQVYDLDATLLGASETDGTMKYSIMSETPAGGFTVRSDTGQVVSLVTMDYETSAKYDLTLQACIVLDCSIKKVDFTLTIAVIDINDNTPYFNDGSYSIQVEEIVNVSTVLDTIITATDEDNSSPFNVLTYTLTGTSTDFELVDSTSGAIKVANSLNFQSQSEYSYLLSVSDGGTPAKSAQVSVVIQVQDSNTNDPIFTTGSTTTVPDSSPVGSDVFHFHATDADTGPAGELSYGIIIDSSGGVFSLDPSTGILTTGQLLDAAVVPSYTLTIQVEDRGTPIRSAQSTLTITVESTVPNNNDPVFSPTVINVGLARDATFGTLVTTALASDADNGNSGELRHKIQAGNSDGYFAIDSQTGQITTVTSVLLANDAYTLTVVAKDNGVPQRSATATVSVVISPPKTTLTTVDYSWTVTENEDANTEVGRIDVDTGRTVTGTYAIELGNFANTFKISLNAGDSRGILEVNVPPDYETKPLFSLLVKVGTDIGDVYKVVQIQVVDTNDEPPVFAQSSYTLTLAENTPIGSTVETISYTDADSDSANRDNILEVKAPGTSLFTIDQLGHLTLLTSPDFESMSTPITFDVTARENKSPAVTATTVVTVNVIDILEEETVPSSDVTDDALISLELPYQSSNGHVLHTFKPGDFGIAESATATVEYVTVQAGDPFTIDTTGTITVTDSTLLTDATKYIRWVICRSTDGGVVTSRLSLIRIDTFDRDTQMIVIEFAESLTNLRNNIVNFKKRTQVFFSAPTRVGFAQTFDTSTSGARRRLLATQSVAYAYAVADTSADDIANLNQNKTFMTQEQLLAILQQSADGSPVAGLSDPSSLTVSTVQPFGSTATSNSFWKTPAGIAILVLITLFIVILVGFAVVCLLYRREKKK